MSLFRSFFPAAALLFLLGRAAPLAAQQQAQYSQYMNNNYILNPGVAGTEDYIDLKFSHRRQWVGLEGAPQTYYVSAHSTVGKVMSQKAKTLRDRHRSFHAVGGLVYRDVTGPTSRTGVYGSYAYNMAFTPKLRGALGVSLGGQQFAVDGAQLRFRDPGEPLGSVSVWVPDAMLGAWVYSSTFYAGLSAGQLFGNLLDFNYSRLGPASANNRLLRHYFFTAGVRLPLTPDWALVPSVLIKSVRPAPLSADFNAKLKYQELFWVGASYRSFDSFAGLVGVAVNDLVTIGYSYDSGVSALRDYNVGSHEVLVGLRVPKKKKVVCVSRFW
ncbi:type IX secretion system membrane protein PorP/SprF [Hymenobacter sp.]|uniref:PorP/SprF family type IX secretion system membrane protein n=1 Tax=Hymenobacter sp. TaxID=1898978 RepID=UPI00286BA77D|nr:type IX secretion system membrane protein PorP/SprF [Hymenobacter sp.]